MNSNINATKTDINVNKFKEITVLGTFCLCDLMDNLVYKIITTSLTPKKLQIFFDIQGHK
jgi:hypothetical protein